MNHEPLNPGSYQADLNSLLEKRIFFGHQSVGRNVMQGVARLAKQANSPLRIIPIDTLGLDSLPGIFHTHIGKNLDPIGKCEAFTQFLSQPATAAFDVALMKFCYVDLSRDGFRDTKALVEKYATSVNLVRAAKPGLKLVHITIPLRTDPPGWKTKLKRWARLDTEEDADNHLRNIFNTELRNRFAGEPFFDLALAESTLPNGERSFFRLGADTVYTLAAIYSTDGGHLNEAGEAQVAQAFIHSIAQAIGKTH